MIQAAALSTALVAPVALGLQINVALDFCWSHNAGPKMAFSLLRHVLSYSTFYVPRAIYLVESSKNPSWLTEDVQQPW